MLAELLKSAYLIVNDVTIVRKTASGIGPIFEGRIEALPRHECLCTIYIAGGLTRLESNQALRFRNRFVKSPQRSQGANSPLDNFSMLREAASGLGPMFEGRIIALLLRECFCKHFVTDRVVWSKREYRFRNNNINVTHAFACFLFVK